MFLADTHTHSSCSFDGSASMTEMANGALRAGLSGLCITDHCDMLSLDGSERRLHYDWEPVLSQWEQMQRACGDRLELTLGIELGMGQINEQAAQKILTQPKLDFVLGAIHNFSEGLGGKDLYFTDYRNQDDCYFALDDYFASMELLADMPNYDVLAHIIYPLRYMVGSYEPPELIRYTDILRRIFKSTVQAGKGIELNTWRGQTVREWIPVLQLYKQCGGEIVTVGSDAHNPEGVGLGVAQAYQALLDTGFHYVAYYHRREPTFVKIT